MQIFDAMTRGNAADTILMIMNGELLPCRKRSNEQLKSNLE